MAEGGGAVKSKTAGKATRPCKSPAAQINKLKSAKLTLKEFQELSGAAPLSHINMLRESIEHTAREHALITALEYYLPALDYMPEKQRVDSLRKLVFGNWLQEHAFTEKFQPLFGIGR